MSIEICPICKKEISGMILPTYPEKYQCGCACLISDIKPTFEEAKTNYKEKMKKQFEVSTSQDSVV